MALLGSLSALAALVVLALAIEGPAFRNPRAPNAKISQLEAPPTEADEVQRLRAQVAALQAAMDILTRNANDQLAKLEPAQVDTAAGDVQLDPQQVAAQVDVVKKQQHDFDVLRTQRRQLVGNVLDHLAKKAKQTKEKHMESYLEAELNLKRAIEEQQERLLKEAEESHRGLFSEYEQAMFSWMDFETKGYKLLQGDEEEDPSYIYQIDKFGDFERKHESGPKFSDFVKFDPHVDHKPPSLAELAEKKKHPRNVVAKPSQPANALAAAASTKSDIPLIQKKLQREGIPPPSAHMCRPFSS